MDIEVEAIANKPVPLNSVFIVSNDGFHTDVDNVSLHLHYACDIYITCCFFVFWKKKKSSLQQIITTCRADFDSMFFSRKPHRFSPSSWIGPC